MLRTAVATTALAAPLVRAAYAAAQGVPSGSMVLGWHTNIAPRWLDPLQHDGGPTPDNFFNAVHDALIKNFYDRKFDYLALAEHFDLAEDAKSATFRLRPGLKFHNGGLVTPADVKWSYEHYHGAWAKVLHEKTDRVEVVDDRTIGFVFNVPFLDFPLLIGTANVCGTGKTRETDHHRRGPERARSAIGLPLPPALSACHAAMRDGGPAPQRGRPAAHGGLPPVLSGGPIRRKARSLPAAPRVKFASPPP